MRIAYVCADPGVPVFGSKGCSLHAQEVIREFLRRGDTVELFAVRPGGEPPEELLRVRSRTVPMRTADEVSERETALLEANTTVARLLTEQGPFDLIYERHSLWAYAAAEYGLRTGTPMVLEVNAPLIEEQSLYRELANRTGAEAASRRCHRAASLVACVSAGVAEYSLQQGAIQSRIQIVPNGVRTDRFLAATRGLYPDTVFTLGFVGTLRPWHAVNDLIDAYAIVRSRGVNIRLLVVGDGPQRDILTQQAASLPESVARGIEWVGAVSPELIPAYLARMDVAVAPYASAGACYFSPLKLFEYMAAGLPIVAANAGQLDEVLEEAVTALLYEPGDVRSLANAIQRVHDDPSLAARMGEAARTEARLHHGWDRRVESMVQAALSQNTVVVGGY